jgi:hypothetical protein
MVASLPPIPGCGKLWLPLRNDAGGEHHARAAAWSGHPALGMGPGE